MPSELLKEGNFDQDEAIYQERMDMDKKKLDLEGLNINNKLLEGMI